MGVPAWMIGDLEAWFQSAWARSKKNHLRFLHSFVFADLSVDHPTIFLWVLLIFEDVDVSRALHLENPLHIMARVFSLSKFRA